MKTVALILGLICCLISCAEKPENQSGRDDTTTNAVLNAEGAETNPYNLPGSDTGAIHENTSQPGILDMDARESTQQSQ